MNGSGCNTCPVKGCDTMNYRGSRCAALRHQHGLGDPMTNADRIRAMSDEELADILYKQTDLDGQIKSCQNLPECAELLDTEEGIPEHKCKDCLLKWLQTPVKEE